MSDQFLKERWQEKVKEENGEKKKWQYEIADLEEMIESAKINKKDKENLILILNWLKNSCKNYVNINEKWIAARKNLEEGVEERKGAIAAMEAADRARRACHQVIFDNLNILSRTFSKYGLDCQWRQYFGDWEHNKDFISQWAYDMGQMLIKTDKNAD